MSDDRHLPHSLDAERAVLGAMLLDPDATYIVGGVLKAEDFFREAHRRIYAAIVAVVERGVESDFLTAKNELQKRGDLDECGGPAYLASLGDGVPRATNVEYYARIIREKAILRAIIRAADTMKSAAYDASDDAAEIIDAVERAMVTVTQDATPGDLVFLEALVPSAMTLLEQITQTKRPVTGLETGWRALDGPTRGLQPGNLIVLGGRPGEGKSAFALQLALHAATIGPVAFFSMEMNRDELTTRALAQVARVNHHDMMRGHLCEADQAKVGRARIALEQRQLAIDDTAALTPFQIRSKAKTVQARAGLSLVVVDYLQLLQRPRHSHSREEAVADNTWALKVLAGELKVPVLALSQLNRSSVKDERRPTLSDLRESGAVEQHANVVLLLYRPPGESNGAVNVTPLTELLIAKQRNGPSQWAIDMVFQAESMRFEEADVRHG